MLIAVLPLAVQAEDPNPLTAGLSLGIGVQQFTDPVLTGTNTNPVSYQSLGLSPDLAFGQFGIGLNFAINYRFENGSPIIRQWDWWPENATFQSVLDLWLPKFEYVRWGTKGQPLYVKAGQIDDGTLGNGFIMSGYSNALFAPTKRFFGMSLDIDGALFQFPLLGFESFFGNLAQFDVLGGRFYVRPLMLLEIPILKDLQVGATIVADLKPQLFLTPDDPTDTGTAVAVYGCDFRLPIIGTEAVSLAAFGDIASINAQSLGGMLGAGGRLFGIVTYGAQLRVMAASFIPSYFDATYDLFRAVKYDVVKAAESGVIAAWFASTGFSLLDDKIVFYAGINGPFNATANKANPVNYPHLRGIFQVKEGLVPGLSFDFSYDKSMIKTFSDLISAADAAILAKLNYKTGPAVISFVYKIRYAPENTPNPWDITSGLESSIKLF
jgi:hypothetical protein